MDVSGELAGVALTRAPRWNGNLLPYQGVRTGLLFGTISLPKMNKRRVTGNFDATHCSKRARNLAPGVVACFVQ